MGIEIFFSRQDGLLRPGSSGNRTSSSVGSGVADNKRNLAIAAVADNNRTAPLAASSRNAGINIIGISERVSNPQKLFHCNIHISTRAAPLSIDIVEGNVAGFKANIAAVTRCRTIENIGDNIPVVALKRNSRTGNNIASGYVINCRDIDASNWVQLTPSLEAI